MAVSTYLLYIMQFRFCLSISFIHFILQNSVMQESHAHKGKELQLTILTEFTDQQQK